MKFLTFVVISCHLLLPFTRVGFSIKSNSLLLYIAYMNSLVTWIVWTNLLNKFMENIKYVELIWSNSWKICWTNLFLFIRLADSRFHAKNCSPSIKSHLLLPYLYDFEYKIDYLQYCCCIWSITIISLVLHYLFSKSNSGSKTREDLAAATHAIQVHLFFLFVLFLLYNGELLLDYHSILLINVIAHVA